MLGQLKPYYYSYIHELMRNMNIWDAIPWFVTASVELYSVSSLIIATSATGMSANNAHCVHIAN